MPSAPSPTPSESCTSTPPTGLLARLLPAVAGRRDREARRILAEAAGHLVELAGAVRARLGPLPVAITGGVFRCAAIRDAVVAATGATDPAEPPELGAIRLLDGSAD